mgnify:CR=1 FL=1
MAKGEGLEIKMEAEGRDPRAGEKFERQDHRVGEKVEGWNHEVEEVEGWDPRVGKEAKGRDTFSNITAIHVCVLYPSTLSSCEVYLQSVQYALEIVFTFLFLFPLHLSMED